MPASDEGVLVVMGREYMGEEAASVVGAAPEEGAASAGRVTPSAAAAEEDMGIWPPSIWASAAPASARSAYRRTAIFRIFLDNAKWIAVGQQRRGREPGQGCRAVVLRISPRQRRLAVSLTTKAEVYLLEPQLKRQHSDNAFLLVNKGSFIVAIPACGHVLPSKLPPRNSHSRFNRRSSYMGAFLQSRWPIDAFVSIIHGCGGVSSHCDGNRSITLMMTRLSSL